MKNVVDFLQNKFERQIMAHQALPAEPGLFAPFPDALNEPLRNVLRMQGIDSLYSHQSEAFDHIAAGRDTVLVSRTASGKTLSFLLPILNDYMACKAPFSVLLLYPTKALSRDQENTLGKLMKIAAKSQKLGTFDGDTPREERQNIQRMADFVITNPDMLHAGILPNHNRRWKAFLSRLKYIVVDEVHSYRGAFGSHVANVFRRLLRICDIHGSSPTFVCSSATVGNPGEHVEALFGRPFVILDRDGAPRPQRDLYFVNPPLVQSQGAALYRKGTGSISIPLLRKAAQENVRTICFCRARQQVERLYRAVTDGRYAYLRDKIKPYRGGLLPSERRQLERDLFEGRINTIITTNALELGIDIGDLDLCVLSGHPGTIASFWQQAGRVGRKGSNAVIVYIAKDAPVDQYLVNHPEFVTSTPIEQAWLNADNPYIVLQHLPCAAYEHPLRPEEPLFTGAAFDVAVSVLAEDGTLTPYHDCHRYTLSDYPAKGVNLRGMTDYNVEIVH
ncbi:MAG: DEAD/DEAH box helicase, partial [Lentisphaeria bacterium]|nr:DEAD/DEAH box helicase [Lentisphaeria bacterium]